MKNPNPSISLCIVPCKFGKQSTKCDFYSSILHITTVTANLFEILVMLSGMCLTYKLKCFPSILVWPILMHYHQLNIQLKNSVCKVFSILQLSLSTCLIFRITSNNVKDMCNKEFPLNFGMAYPNPSIFSGNVQWKLVNQYNHSSDFQSIFHMIAGE